MSYSEPTTANLDVSDAPIAPALRLWTPRVIALLTFFLGVPGGLALAIYNWYRMGLWRQVVPHLVIFVLYSTLIGYALSQLPASIMFWVTSLINIVTLTYLRLAMLNDLKQYADAHPAPIAANWLLGVLLALGGFALFFVLEAAFIFVLLLANALSHALLH